MKYPAIAAVPPVAVRKLIPASTWADTITTWTDLIKVYRHAGNTDFKTICKSDSLAAFLVSLYGEHASSDQVDSTLKSAQADQLAQQCIGLLVRAQAAGLLHTTLHDLDFLKSLARWHTKSPQLKKLLQDLWSTSQAEVEKALGRWQSSMTSLLETTGVQKALLELQQIAPLLYGSPQIAASLLTGSDFIEAAQSSYGRASSELKRTLTLVLYLSFTGLAFASQTSSSMLADHLFAIKGYTDKHKTGPSLLVDLVTNTPLLRRLEEAAGQTGSERLVKLIEQLKTYRAPSQARERNRKQLTTSKGKQRAGIDTEMHVHRISLVTQIQDLFPDLGAGYVLRLLDAYNDNVEEITAHLLEGSLPDELATIDKHEPAPIFDSDRAHVVDNLIPRSTPSPPDLFVPIRHNAFDDDELDRLQLDTTRLHIGKRENDEDSSQPNKAAILAALAAFDSDDDERDDTYDAEDVGGTVDTAHHDGDDSVSAPLDENDVKLYKRYEVDPAVFGRSAEIRRSKDRAALKLETGMTDEAIEGWAIMLQRQPRRARKLAFEASRFDGRQTDIARTSYREGEESDAERSVPSFRGRGRGRGGGGRGGTVSGPKDDPSTATAQRRKEANKSSRANHNRRNQRARKMARGGFAPTG